MNKIDTQKILEELQISCKKRGTSLTKVCEELGVDRRISLTMKKGGTQFVQELNKLMIHLL